MTNQPVESLHASKPLTLAFSPIQVDTAKAPTKWSAPLGTLGTMIGGTTRKP
jgi:hypothetical protein